MVIVFSFFSFFSCMWQIQEKLRPPSLSLSLPPRGLGGRDRDKDPPPKLHVFFSSPLATQDRERNWHTLQLLDYSGERDMLIQVCGEVRRDGEPWTEGVEPYALHTIDGDYSSYVCTFVFSDVYSDCSHHVCMFVCCTY